MEINLIKGGANNEAFKDAFFIFLAMLTWSCATVAPPVKPEPLSLLYLDGAVQSQSGNIVTLQMNMPELRSSPCR